MTLVRTKTNRNGFQGLFDDLFTPEFPLGRLGYAVPATSLPKVNIKESDNHFQLEVAAPGLEKSDFNIKLDQDLLTISSEKKEEALKDDHRYSKKEFSFQAFRRVFTLPEQVETDQIEASYHNGVLVVTIPKKEEAKPQPPKSIQIG